MRSIKTILFAVLLSIAFTANAEAIYTSGEAIDFQSGFVGSFWHPYLTLSQVDSNDGRNEHHDLLTVILKTSNTYHSFPQNSKLLLKFSDNSIVELDSFGDVIMDYQLTSLADEYIRVYYTGRHYDLTDEALQKILTLPIIKVRIELSNGIRKDYEVGVRHGKKVLKKIKKSYEIVKKRQQLRIRNSNGDLKDDF